MILIEVVVYLWFVVWCSVFFFFFFFCVVNLEFHVVISN